MTTPATKMQMRSANKNAGIKLPNIYKIISSVFCIIPASYFILMLGFALFNAQDFASATPQLIRYVIVPGLIATALLACAFFAPARISATVGGIFIGMLGGLFAFETLLTARMFTSLMGMVSVPQRQWLAQAGATRSLPPAYTLIALNKRLDTKHLSQSVLSGMPYERVLMCVNGGKPVFYTADRYGFNNPDSAYTLQTSVLILGDSFVEGLCLPPNDNLVSNVRKIGFNAIGLGMRGGGPLIETAMLGRFGPALKPKHVMMVFYEGNDWENLEIELDTPWLREAMKPDADFGATSIAPGIYRQSQKVISDWVQSETPNLFEVIQKTHLTRNFFALHETGTQLGIGYPKAALHKPEYQQILEQAKNIVSAWDGELYIVYLPQGSRFEGLFPSAFVHDQRRREVYKAADALDLPVIDLTPAYEKLLKHTPIYASDGHLNSQGAQLTASMLAKHLPNTEKSMPSNQN